MPRKPAARAATAALLVIAVAVAGCSSKKKSTADLPAAGGLLFASQDAMRQVQTAHVTIDVTGSISGLVLHRADGQLTRDGKAKGTATVEQSGQTVELDFVIVGSTLYLKGPTGGWQQVPLALASTVYDPSAILDPERGMVKLMSTARGAKTEAKEQVDGTDAYRIGFTPSDDVMSVLIPGIGSGSAAKVWVAVDSKRLLKATFTLPPTSTDKGGTATIRFTEYDAPVTINAP
jgi:lipoprotein LprG